MTAALTLSTSDALEFDIDSIDAPEYEYFINENGDKIITDPDEIAMIEAMLADYNDKSETEESTTNIPTFSSPINKIANTRANQIQAKKPVTMIFLASEDIITARFNAAAITVFSLINFVLFLTLASDF